MPHHKILLTAISLGIYLIGNTQITNPHTTPGNALQARMHLQQKLTAGGKPWMLTGKIEVFLGNKCEEGEQLIFGKENLTSIVCENGKFIRHVDRYDLIQTSIGWQIKYGQNNYDLKFEGETLVFSNLTAIKAQKTIVKRFAIED